MRKKRPIVLFAIGMLFATNCLAQLPYGLYRILPDSIKPHNPLHVSIPEGNELMVYAANNISPQYYYCIDKIANSADSSLNFNKSLLNKITTAEALGTYFFGTSRADSALCYFNKVVDLIGKNKDYQHFLTNAYYYIGLKYLYDDNDEIAFDYLRKYINLSGTIDSSISFKLNKAYSIVYSKLQLYPKSIFYQEDILKQLSVQSKWSVEYSKVKLDEALAYANFYQKSGNATYIDSSLHIINEVMVAQKSDSLSWYGACYYFKGLIDFYQNNYKQALAYFNLSLSFNATDRYFKNTTEKDMYQALCLIKTNNFELGKKILDGLWFGQNYKQILIVNKTLYEYAKQKEEWKTALLYHEKYMDYKDSVNVLNLRASIFYVNEKDLLSQKKASIQLLATKDFKETNARQLTIALYTVALVLLALFILLLYLAKKRQKAKHALEWQTLADKLQKMEHTMDLRMIRQQHENDNAIKAQRKTISKDMHDEISGGLAALRFYISDLQRNAQSEETKDAMGRVGEETMQVYLQARDFMHRLQKGNNVHNYNMVDFLNNLSQTFGPDSSLHIRTKIDAEKIGIFFTQKQHSETYRIIREAVANAMKHASATILDIGLYFKEGRFYFTISDNGTGMQNISTGMGLVSMQERAKGLGGEMLFTSTSSGITIKGSFPAAMNPDSSNK